MEYQVNKAWIDVQSYYSIIEQAAKNNGKAVITSRGSGLLEIMIDPEFAKKEWADIEAYLKRFGGI